MRVLAGQDREVSIESWLASGASLLGVDAREALRGRGFVRSVVEMEFGGLNEASQGVVDLLLPGGREARDQESSLDGEVWVKSCEGSLEGESLGVVGGASCELVEAGVEGWAVWASALVRPRGLGRG